MSASYDQYTTFITTNLRGVAIQTCLRKKTIQKMRYCHQKAAGVAVGTPGVNGRLIPELAYVHNNFQT